MHGAFKLGQRWKEAAMDGLELVDCQLAGSAWQHFYPTLANNNIVVHDIGYVIQWLCISIIQ